MNPVEFPLFMITICSCNQAQIVLRPYRMRYHPSIKVSSIRQVCSSPSTHLTPSWLQRISPIRPGYCSNKISPPHIARRKIPGYHCTRLPSNFQPFYPQYKRDEVQCWYVEITTSIEHSFCTCQLTASLSAVMFPGWTLRRFSSVKRA